MTYTPNIWSQGDVVTSAKLNAIEQGIAGSDYADKFIVNLTIDEDTSQGTGDKTWNEVETAWNSGKIVYFKTGNGNHICTCFKAQSEGVDGSAWYIGYSTSGQIPYYGHVTGSGNNPVEVIVIINWN